MPELSAIIVDWDIASEFDKDGTLNDKFYDEQTNGNWVDSPDAWHCDSGRFCFDVGDALAKMVPHIEEPNATNVRELLDLLQWKAGYEFETKVECIAFAMSPPTVNAIAKKLVAINYAPFESLFDQHCTNFNRSLIPDFDEDFIGYLQQWEGVFAEARNRGWGVLFHSG